MRFRTLPDHARAYLTAHPTATPAQMAAALGYSVCTARIHRHYAIRDGLVPSLRPRLALTDLTELIVNGMSTRKAAQQLGLSVAALRHHLRRRDIRLDDLRHNRVYAGRDVMTLLGYPPTRAVMIMPRLVASGLVARRESRRKHSPWRVADYDLADWLPDAARRGIIDATRITDPELRAHAVEGS